MIGDTFQSMLFLYFGKNMLKCIQYVVTNSQFYKNFTTS